jgi:Tfp pilus assembly protein PilX
MNTRKSGRRRKGFALIITLVLLALLVLAVFALSALTRVNSRIATASLHQTQARQNALLGLNVALGHLQQSAGDDRCITGMAGISGITADAGNSTRHWCGVWRNDGTFITWLASGAVNPANAGSNPVELVSTGSVGAAASTSPNVEKEHVIAGKIPIIVSEAPGSPGVASVAGHYAYLVTDEGCKIGAYAPPAQLAVPGVVPQISPGMLTNQLRLRAALTTHPAKLPAIISYEQLSLVPTPPSSAQLTPSVLQDCFHYVTLTPRTVAGNRYLTGTININTASPQLWRCLLDTYNSVPGVTRISAANVVSAGNAIGRGFAASASGKSPNGPFTSVADFGASTLLADNLPDTITPAQFMSAIGALLVVRSDTFRVRAFGETVNPADPAKIEATAWCEAIVQRTTEPAPAGLGQRFKVTYFRWLGPDDI